MYDFDDDLILVLSAKDVVDPEMWYRFGSISDVSREQLFVQAAEGLEELEEDVLKEIDNLVNKVSPLRSRKGRSSWEYHYSDPIIVGLCIRRLALLYRRIMRRYKRIGVGQRYENARTLYDAMTRHYARVFKGTLSPWSPDWHIEEHRDAFNGDEDLIEKFKALDLAETRHCQSLSTALAKQALTPSLVQTEINSDYDSVYTRLFAEKKDKKQRTPAQKWSKTT